MEVAYWHGLYDKETYDKIHNNNCLEDFAYFEWNYPFNIKEVCLEALLEFRAKTIDIDIYNLYGPCYNDSGIDSFEMYDSEELYLTRG